MTSSKKPHQWDLIEGTEGTSEDDSIAKKTLEFLMTNIFYGMVQVQKSIQFLVFKTERWIDISAYLYLLILEDL